MPLYPRVEWMTSISSDVSGNPAIVMDGTRAYFAFLGISTGYSSITVGCVDLSGTLLWTFRDPRMVTKAHSHA